jgi:hypothetical protein
MEAPANFPRLFTVNEANLLLPTLRPIIERILENLRRLKMKSETVIRNEQLDPDASNFMEQLRRDDEIAKLIEQIKNWVEEIHSHGCVCKGVEQGLIDFPCMLGAEIVFLCWQFGEPSVGYWHRIDDGFAGRRALIDAEQEDPDDGNTSYH